MWGYTLRTPPLAPFHPCPASWGRPTAGHCLILLIFTGTGNRKHLGLTGWKPQPPPYLQGARAKPDFEQKQLFKFIHFLWLHPWAFIRLTSKTLPPQPPAHEQHDTQSETVAVVKIISQDNWQAESSALQIHLSRYGVTGLFPRN